jgi:hypothetical protein
MTSRLALPLLGHRDRHKWMSAGITRDGQYRLQCRCGAVLLRPVRPGLSERG